MVNRRDERGIEDGRSAQKRGRIGIFALRVHCAQMEFRSRARDPGRSVLPALAALLQDVENLFLDAPHDRVRPGIGVLVDLSRLTLNGVDAHTIHPPSCWRTLDPLHAPRTGCIIPTTHTPQKKRTRPTDLSAGLARSGKPDPSTTRRRARPHQGAQVIWMPFVRLKVEEVQNTAALRYQHWYWRTLPAATPPLTETDVPPPG